MVYSPGMQPPPLTVRLNGHTAKPYCTEQVRFFPIMVLLMRRAMEHIARLQYAPNHRPQVILKSKLVRPWSMAGSTKIRLHSPLPLALMRPVIHVLIRWFCEPTLSLKPSAPRSSKVHQPEAQVVPPC